MSIYYEKYNLNNIIKLFCGNLIYILYIILYNLSMQQCILKKCVIITTINAPSETVIKHIKNPNYDVIIVGDIKTPSTFNALNCIYLDIEKQKNLYPKLSQLIPYNHYGRKNIGYLYAITNGYNVIYETDDDNIPYDDFDTTIYTDHTNVDILSNNTKWINIFKYFTNNSHIWPRGFPLSLIKSPSTLITNTNTEKINPSVINGLVENDPDVDALFRLICTHSVDWELNKQVLISNQNMCCFNTQNTFWLNRDLFISMLIPSSVSFRYCDILRGIITNIVLKYTNNYMMFISPNVVQNRNEHNLISDFKSEYDMYIANEFILDIIENNIVPNLTLSQLLKQIYINLLDHNIIKQLDIDILDEWLSYFTIDK